MTTSSKSVAPTVPSTPQPPASPSAAVAFPSNNQPNTAALASAQRVASIQAATPSKTEKPVQFYTPAFWDIKRISEDAIVATHNILGDVFEGSMQDFKKLLKP